MTTPHPPVALVTRLAKTLDEREISYCHWKSNAFIARSEAAENDLDLLIARNHADAFREALSFNGFTRVERQEPITPGKEDYVGFDQETGKLVHIDALYQLVVGHDRTKNYRIPIEDVFLSSAQGGGLLRVPSPELEYVVFVVRMVLKYALWDEMVWQRLRGRQKGLKQSEREELMYLEARIDPDRVSRVVREHAPWLGVRLLDACIAVARGDSSTVERLKTGRSLRASLDTFARHGPTGDTLRRIWRRLVLGVQLRLGRKPRFRLASGGAIIGIMGGDGAGKSTAIDELGSWLEKMFDVRRVHLGKPPWSTTTYVVRGTFKAASVVGSLRLPLRSEASQGSDTQHDYRAMAWLACTARDRYLTYREARRFANRGGLVLSDRYPHPALDSMDVPLISRLFGSQNQGRIASALARTEHYYHDRIGLPEVLAVLMIDPERAAERKTDEPADYVRTRVAEVWQTDWEALSVDVIDALQPVDGVTAELKSVIWAALN